MGPDRPTGPENGGHDDPLPGSARGVGPALHRDRGRPDVAAVRRVRHRQRPGLSDHSPGDARPLRGLQPVAGAPARPARHPGPVHHLEPARTAPHVHRADHRVGLRRRRGRSPDLFGDFPDRDEPLPKFLDDPTAAKFMAGLATDPNPRRRLVVELLARTGMRTRNCPASGRRQGSDRDHALAPDPGRQAHNDRYVPLLPALAEQIDHYQATRGPCGPTGSSNATTVKPSTGPGTTHDAATPTAKCSAPSTTRTPTPPTRHDQPQTPTVRWTGGSSPRSQILAGRAKRTSAPIGAKPPAARTARNEATLPGETWRNRCSLVGIRCRAAVANARPNP